MTNNQNLHKGRTVFAVSGLTLMHVRGGVRTQILDDVSFSVQEGPKLSSAKVSGRA